MPSRFPRRALHAHVKAIMDETGESDPFDAVRQKARVVVTQFESLFTDEPPFNMKAVASMRGLHWSDDDPRFSADSEIAPESGGRVVLRVNKSRPLSRQRFSIGHEIGHTLFPEYELAVRCRKAIDRNWADPDDLIETLCDVAASELLFPSPWFSARVQATAPCAAALAALADACQASRDATIRRYVELSNAPLAGVFFSWKLKPTESRKVKRDARQTPMFADFVPLAPQPMLRIDYAIINDAFASDCVDHLPKDKSVPSDGPIFAASSTQSLQDGECDLDLGTVQGRFQTSVLPIFTAEDSTGPQGSCSVVALLQPA